MAHNVGRKGIKHTLSHTIFCSWCNERKEVTRPDAQFCSRVCRQKMSRLVALTGFAPDEPPGPRGVQEVYLELVQILLSREQSRRQAAANERAKYLALRESR